MHIIKAHEPAVTLFARAGEVRVFKTFSDALRQLGIHWISSNVAAEFTTFSRTTRRFRVDQDAWFIEPVYTEADYVMRDDFGNKVTVTDFWPLNSGRKRWVCRYRRLFDTWNGEGAVPGICRAHGGHYHRRPRTLDERRIAQALPGEPAPRAKRNGLPSDWDDLAISSRGVRSWKRHRKQQWKA